MTAGPDRAVETLRHALEGAGLDPRGLDLDRLAAVKLETEAKIAGHRAAPGFACAAPVFIPPDDFIEPRRED